jgi:prepilin-type N-terminal cleavage/methylation domain-containing protein
MSSSRGFTLVEILISLSLALFVLTGTLTTYLFLGRQLTKLNNQQTLDAESRRVLAQFNQDVRQATAISSPSDTAVTLSQLTATGSFTVTYTYTAGTNYNGTLVRTTSTGTSLTLARNLGSFDFDYFDSLDAAVASPSSKLSSVRKISLDYTSMAGYASRLSGAATPVNTVESGRIVMRNLGFLP